MEENRESKKITFDDLQYLIELIIEYRAEQRSRAMEELNNILFQDESPNQIKQVRVHVDNNIKATGVLSQLDKVLENYNRRDIWEDYYDLRSAGFYSDVILRDLSSILNEILLDRKTEYRRAFDDLVDTIGQDTAVFLPVCFKQMKDTIKDLETYLTWI